MNKPDYQLIREMEHECGIGLPHEDGCALCQSRWAIVYPETAVSGNVIVPSQDEWTEIVNRRHGPG